ncbi:hypothetical protein ACS0TY_016197 [Phlomoides rotata]
MNQLSRGAMKWSRLIGEYQLNRRLPSTSFTSPKLFSTEAAESSPVSSSNNQLRTPPSGSVYGRLSITKHTTKSDVINLLEGSQLSPEKLKVEYNLAYIPLSMMVEFPSLSSYNTALKTISRKNRLYTLQRAEKADWEMVSPYDGKALILIGIPRNALPEDVERFLSGCQFDSSLLDMFFRTRNQATIRMARIHFRSQALAMHTFITKNRGFVLNNQINVEVLH